MREHEHVAGEGSPRVAVVASVHGDELIGLKVIEKLRNLKLARGTLGLFVANPAAVRKARRYIARDLNRVFPGKRSGNREEKVAYALKKKLGAYDVVLDIHGTNSRINALAIVTKTTSRVKGLLRRTPIRKVALIPKKVFGGKEMIAHCRLGLSLEYGPNKSAKRYEVALRHVTTILKNMGLVEGKQSLFPKKDLYRVYDSYPIPNGFTLRESLKDFRRIRKHEKLGVVRGNPVFSRQEFHPLFLGKGMYPNTLALMASKESIEV